MSVSFEQTLRLSGLHPRDIAADGKWYRCATDDHPRKRNGAYKLEIDGRVGFWRNWATDSSVNVWHEATGGSSVAPIDPAAQARQREESRRRRIEGIGWARALWQASAPFSGHRYLSNKGLSAEGCHMLRLWRGSVWIDRDQRVEDTWLIVPLYWRDRLVNVQRISSTGVKRQMKQAPQKAASLILNRPRAAVTVICEGLATGLAVFQSVRCARVVVAYFADNLLPVVQELKPSGSVVIAADNDWGTQAKRGFNPGREKASNAADLIGCGVVWPEGIEGTDFADYLQEIGQGAARKVERLVLSGARYVEAPA